MNKDNLYKLTLEERWTSESGEENVCNEILLGFYVGEENRYFYGSCFCYEENRWFGGDTVELSKSDFEKWVKKVEEI